MPLLIPGATRPTCPDSIIERAFAKFEELCPEKYHDELIEEAKLLATCKAGDQLMGKRARAIVQAAINTVSQPDLAGTGAKRLATVRASAAYAYALLQEGRNSDAVAVAVEVIAETVGLRQGAEDGQRALWREAIEHLGALRRIE